MDGKGWPVDGMRAWVIRQGAVGIGLDKPPNLGRLAFPERSPQRVQALRR